MSGSKHFDRVAVFITALMLVVTILFMNGAALGIEAMTHSMGYEDRLFDNTKVHTVDIVMNDWDEFIDDATSEEYYTANVVIDGESYKNVGIRAKGNTSLSTVSSLGSERYSFKIEFDHYDSTKSYHGLDKLSLNNLIQDSTMMKDYLTYTMMNEFGVASPLCSYVYITVNGRDWGLYLAVEGIEEAFLERNYGSDYGELYKPDSMSFGGGRGNGKDFNMEDFMNTVDTSGESSESSGGITMPDMGGYDSSAMFGGEMPDKGNFDPSQMQGDMPQKPDMPQGNSENSDTSSFGGGRGDFNLSIDEETLRAAFEELNLDMALLDGIDFEKITMESIQSVLSSLDEETMQKLMHEVMNSGSLEMPDMGGMGGFGGMGSADAKLQYIDDNASSYSSIWNSAKTDITTTDQTRLIESLKKLSNGEQIESVVDIEQVIRYFVVHNYVCNGDSYTGSMIHNYYLYEENGQMAMIPWDYNLAFGTFQGGNAQSTVNTPIDAPVSGSSSEDRPMWNWILSDETYIELYHQNFTDFMNTVDIGGIIDNAYNLIKSYVEKDPTAFYTYEEFENGVETMRQFCTLRSESISMQLTNGETTSNMNYVDASGLTLSDMGSMSMGGGFRGSDMQGMNGNKGSFGGLGPSDNTDATKSDASENSSSGLNTQRTFATTSEGMPQNGEMPEGFPGQSTGRTETISSVDSGTSDNTGSSGNGNRPSGSNMQMPGGNFDMNGMGNATSNSTNWIWIAVSVLILGAGLIIAKLYKH